MPLLRTALSALLLLGAAAPAPAQTKALGAGKPGGALLSRAELRECLASQDKLKARREETLRLQAQLAKDKEEIVRRGDELKAQLDALDRTSQEQVDRYNAQAAERDKLIDEFEARSGMFNTQAEAVNTQAEAWKRTCENRRYDEKDEIAIKAGR